MTESSGGTKRYPIDVRLFLISIMVGMMGSFSIGALYGPIPMSSSNVEPVEQVPEVKRTNSAAKISTAEFDKALKLGEEHQPAGQHLLIDMKNIEADFLNSESRLADAMVAAVDAGGLTLLSYHCHSLIPAGVSCVGVLLESHISFHTWPEEGVITLDLFTCGSNPLIPLVPIVEELFGIPREDNLSPEDEWNLYELPRQDTPTGRKGVISLWSHELRGFRTKEDRMSHYLDLQSDLALWVTSPIDLHYKKEIVSVQSKYQRIDIWDVLEVSDTPSYEDGLKHNLTEGDPRWFTSEVTSPERMLFLDGTLQTLGDTEREYHEAIVHPAMFAHKEPQHVAILGGGEGATLREVLKHTTVKTVKMIEIDDMIVDISRQYLPKLNSCDDIKGSTPSCFDDPRTELIIEDGHKWFIDHQTDAHKFDVIIMDTLDPEDEGTEKVSTKLYNDKDFLDAAFNSLTPDGVMVIQVGSAPNIHDPKADIGVYSTREKMFQMIEAHPQTKVMHVYEEAHCGFNEPHAFLVICKSNACKEQWYAASDVIDYQIYERIAKTKSGQKAMVHYDGSTQHSFRFPPKAWETVYCRREPTPKECAYIGVPMDRQIFEYCPDESISHFTVNSNDSGTQVFANIDIPKGSFIMPSHLASSFMITDRSYSNLLNSAELSQSTTNTNFQPHKIQKFVKYIEKYGHDSLAQGSATKYVEIGASAFIPTTLDSSKVNVGRWGPDIPQRPIFSPVYDRHRHSFDVFLIATQDIQKGDPILKPQDLWN